MSSSGDPPIGVGDHRIVPYDETWQMLARTLIGRLRAGLGSTAIRLDHIGSTSVIGLAARPIIDVQVSVHDVLGRQAFEPKLVGMGYRHFPLPELPIDDYLLFTPADGSNTEHIDRLHARQSARAAPPGPARLPAGVPGRRCSP